jgi:radical SAM protein with 4Fe4S-binding SPASM domain
MMGIPVTAAFCATRYNYLDVEEVVKLGVNHGIKNIAIGEVLPFGDNTESLKFSQEEYREFVQLMEHVIHKYNPLVDIEYISEWGFLFSNQANRTSCSAMDRDMAILFDGKVSPCPFIRHENYIMGDILISEVKDIWQSVAAKQFRLHKNIGCSNDCVQYSTCMSGCKAPLANLGIPINIENTRCPISPVNRNRTNL